MNSIFAHVQSQRRPAPRSASWRGTLIPSAKRIESSKPPTRSTMSRRASTLQGQGAAALRSRNRVRIRGVQSALQAARRAAAVVPCRVSRVSGPTVPETMSYRNIPARVGLDNGTCSDRCTNVVGIEQASRHKPVHQPSLVVLSTIWRGAVIGEALLCCAVSRTVSPFNRTRPRRNRPKRESAGMPNMLRAHGATRHAFHGLRAPPTLRRCSASRRQALYAVPLLDHEVARDRETPVGCV